MATTTTPTWIGDLVSAERRAEGKRLLDEVLVIREAVGDLFERCAAHVRASDDEFRAALDAVEGAAGPIAAHEISDGLGGLIGELDYSNALNLTLANMGVDLDSLDDEEAARQLALGDHD